MEMGTRGNGLVKRRKRADAFFALPAFQIKPGDDLLSHAVAHIVPSTLRSLTAVFGMGTGVASSP